MIAVADTSPLIALAKIERFDILDALFREIYIPRIVFDEFSTNSYKLEQKHLQSYRNSLINVVDNPQDSAFKRVLDDGERAVLSLAKSYQVQVLLMDDKKARNEALEHDFKPISTRALLLTAERMGVIHNHVQLVDQMHRKGVHAPDY
jgi:predicted nucleic acid-binding protein